MTAATSDTDSESESQALGDSGFERELFDSLLRVEDEPAGLDAPASLRDSGEHPVVAKRLLDSPHQIEGQLCIWLEAIVARDERALSALYDATLSRVYGFIARVVRRPELAEEVVEDTYFQVWRQAARFDPARGRAFTWLLGMARSRAIDALRREAKFRHDDLESEQTPDLHDTGPAPDDLLAAARGHADLHRALMLLDAHPRQLVAMAFLKGLSHDEIASRTSLPLGTVKSQIRRALQTLRQAIGEQGQAGLT